MRRAGHQPWFARMGSRVAPPVDRFVHRLSGGRWHVADLALPTLVLIHRGRRSGRMYHTPLAFIESGDGFALAATNWGQQHHPAWSTNLLADPDVAVEIHGETIPVRARPVDAAEKASLWPRFLRIWPAYDTYVERSGRDIRVFVLDRR